MVKTEDKSSFYEAKSEIYGSSEEIGPAMKVILKIIENMGKNLKILDVGCAHGILGKHLKMMKHTVYGVEISEKLGNLAKKYLDDVVIGDIEKIDPPYPHNFFDVIIFNNILEYLFDPKSTLIKLRKYLKKDGVVIVGLPNIANWCIIKDLIFGKFEYTDSGLLDDGHIRFFTPKSAIKLLEDCGYVVIHHMPAVLNFPFIHNEIKMIQKIQKLVLRIFKHLFVYHFIIVAKKKVIK